MVRMALRWALVIGLATVCAAGCASDDSRKAPEWLQRMHTFWTDVRPDAMQMEFSYVRRSIGDTYLCEGLWHDIDETCIPLEKRPMLAANGLRVGFVTGTVPTKLQHWLCSDGQSEGHRLVQRAGHTSFVPLGPGGADQTITIAEDDRTRTLRLENTQCGLGVRLSVADNGDTLVHLEPCVRYGGLRQLPKLAKDGQSLEVTGERPEEKFPALACEMTLTPSDYIIIGGLADKPSTLGYACFVQPEANEQFILVIRTPRAKPTNLDSSTNADANGGAVPLAIQSIDGAPTPPAKKRG
jgi:hypothetical protein